ncbi:YebC/PmpR family DNA-binding regulatory protein [Caldalkalibacillus uzonensis]|uniref:Probable transcriptional regulatory protein J2S00_002301 n=1 Tax=Caldalkalibacillus uzonensis TaxID=353224 RepID=A0ABU0CTT7_9BACI|nr:YebC/PmpR family DNA-binding transcriptional regulator [Caldalkalibacillus uzonensis]MDQ0339513.1 YebC/PmpR family DNA-binding regulatory protein [Caldalkalibacillus uzonensis]
MAGHSKWKNIQHRKERQDAKRAKIFTKISKEIFAAVKSGGADPEQNTRLRMALQKAKQANMPSDNIQRTIKKATGDVEGVTYEEIVYEGYGPHGVAIMVDVLTDNRNRSAAEVRHLFSKYGGNLGESGCVAYLFERKGLLEINKQELPLEEDELMLVAIEAGAEDLRVEEDRYEVVTTPSDYETVKETLEKENIPLAEAQVTMLPATTVQLDDEQKEQVLKLIDALEDNDDVQNVYTNVDW